MKLSKANLLARKVAGKDKSDPVLNQLWVEPDGTTVASNGNAMMAVEGVSKVPSTLPDFEDEADVGADGCGLPVRLVDETLRNMPKGSLGLELGYAVVTGYDDGKGSVKLTTTDLNLHRTVEGRLSRKRFPEWRGVLRNARKGEAHKVCVDRKALRGLLDAIDAACPDSENAVFIEYYPGATGGGMVLRAVSAETGQHVVGYMLPLDTEGAWLPLNPWERGVVGRAIKRRRVDDAEDAG